MQSEFLRERVRQAVEWGIEDAWPRYNRIYDPHDPDDESRQEWVDCITEQVVTALLRTPAAPVGEDVQRDLQEWVEAIIRDGVQYRAKADGAYLYEPSVVATADRILALLRTPRGEGEAVRRIATVALVLQRRGAPYDEVVSVGVWPEPGEFAALVKLTAGDFYDLAALRSESLGTPRGEDVRESEVGPSEAEMDMARTGMVIQAIKTYRERVGCTLHEARAAIDAALRTPRGEGEAALVEAVLRRWNRLAADVEGSKGPLTETELVGIARDVAAALHSEAQGEEWRPIETAPKDGTRILIGWGDEIRAAYWDPEYESLWDEDAGESRYRGAWTDGAVRSFGYEETMEYKPTHWTPLPDPPAARRGEGGE